MEINEEGIQHSLYEELGIRVGIPLLTRHHLRGQEAYIVRWLKERPDPQKPTIITEADEGLRKFCDNNGIIYMSPSIILWSSRVSPARLGIVGSVFEDGLTSKLYFVKDVGKTETYLRIMEPYLRWFDMHRGV